MTETVQTDQLRKEAEELLTRITPGEWQQGHAGHCNIVSFGGDDIRPVAAVGGLGGNRAFIAAAPRLIRELLAVLLTATSEPPLNGCSLCGREHEADCDLAFATCTCKSSLLGEETDR